MFTPSFYISTQKSLTWEQTLHNVTSSCLYTPYFHTHYDEIDSVSLKKTKQFAIITNPWDAILTVAKVVLAVATLFSVPIACYLYTYSTNTSTHTHNGAQIDMEEVQVDIDEVQVDMDWDEVDAHFKNLTLIEKEIFLIDFLKDQVDKDCAYEEFYQMALDYRKNGFETEFFNHLVNLTPELSGISKYNEIGYDFNQKINNLIFYEDIEGIKALFDDGYPPNRVFYRGENRTILLHASSCDKLKVVAEVIDYLQPEQINAQDKDGRTALALCIAWSLDPQPTTIYMDSEIRDIVAKLPKSRIIEEEERYEIIQKLLENGADANIADEKGYLPLHHAVLKHGYNINKMESIKILTEHTKDIKGAYFLALLLAIRMKSVELVKFFIELGAQIPGSDLAGNSLLHHAALTWDNAFNPEIMEILLKNQPRLVYAVNNKGETPLHIAARDCNVEMVKFLTAHEAFSHIQTYEKKQTPKDLTQQTKNYIDQKLNGEDARGAMAVFWHRHKIPKADEIIKILEIEENYAGPQLRLHFKMKAAGIQKENFAILPSEVQRIIFNLMSDPQIKGRYVINSTKVIT
ncbi:MAG: ankyrin repeat domain-containing protein [Parachlamydiaceae bacterium]|nr:ankyrin repeat domain-containing protein [Parachlamydiaceae bacterium]